MVNFSLLALVNAAIAGELTSNTDLDAKLRQAEAAEHITLHEIGRSVEDRPLWAVRLRRPTVVGENACVVLLIGQQHADEPAGGEALLELIGDVALDPTKLNPSVDLWIIPRINPDGAERSQRRNANDADLNRDHVVMLQPETKALYKLARQIQPHLAVDCHEFGRDSSDYRKQGWTEWPQIMMDTANLAIMPDSLYKFGVQLCEEAGKSMDAAGVNYTRYVVGDCPCCDSTGELRYSTLDADDARNGLSLYGCVSFIIESGLLREAEDPQADLHKRVEAYKLLFDFFLNDSSRLASIRKAARNARTGVMPAAIPTNVMWANQSPTVTDVRVIETATGKVRTIPTTTLMHDRMVKSAVPMPLSYVVPVEHAELFSSLLKSHGIEFTRLDQPTSFEVQRVRLVKMENRYDEVYHRYDGRQITNPLPVNSFEFPAGSLVVKLDDLDMVTARRAAMILEPRQLFGLYQWSVYQDAVSSDEILPVVRRPTSNLQAPLP